jgi:hypothetical protein
MLTVQKCKDVMLVFSASWPFQFFTKYKGERLLFSFNNDAGAVCAELKIDESA